MRPFRRPTDLRDRVRALLAGLSIVLGLALIAVWVRWGRAGGDDDGGTSKLLAKYRLAWSRSVDLAGAPELDGLREGRAFFAALAGETSARRVELGVMGNLNGYASACACSSKGRGGGLAVIGGAVRRWRGARRPALVDIGDSLLPEGDVPAVYRSLFLKKAKLMAELYGLIGVDVFCPSPTDLFAFDDLGALAAWCDAASLSCVVTNLPAAAESERMRRTIELETATLPVVVYALCDPKDTRLHPALGRFVLDPLDAVWARCTLPPEGVRLVVLHNVPLSDCVDRLPRPMERTIYIARGAKDAESRRHPRVIELARGGRILRPTARGQSLSVLQFLAEGERITDIRHAGPDLARFLHAVRQDRPPQAPAAAGMRFLSTEIEFREGSAESIGSLGAVESRLVAHRTTVLRRLLADPPYEPGAVPERRRRLLPEPSCAGCHEAAVAGWKAGPHAHALTTLLEGERKSQAEAGCIRCHLSATSRLVLDAPARTEDHPLRMRKVLSGISCVTCHDDVSSDHIEGRDTGKLEKPAGAVCRRCHDSINSPSFEFATYREKLGCCGHAGK